MLPVEVASKVLRTIEKLQSENRLEDADFPRGLEEMLRSERSPAPDYRADSP